MLVCLLTNLSNDITNDITIDISFTVFYFPPTRKLRCSVYSCIECWVKVTKNLPQERGILPKLVQCIMEDIKPPLSSQVKVRNVKSEAVIPYGHNFMAAIL